MSGDKPVTTELGELLDVEEGFDAGEWNNLPDCDLTKIETPQSKSAECLYNETMRTP